MDSPTIGENQCDSVYAIGRLTKTDGLVYEPLWK